MKPHLSTRIAATSQLAVNNVCRISPEKANERCNVGVAALIHFRGYCPHPSNHLRRRIHQPSLLPHNIHRNAHAAQETHFSRCESRAKSKFETFRSKFNEITV